MGFLQKNISILLLLLYLTTILRSWIPITYYIIKYDYVAEVLCINQNKPEMNCNGQCYLSKELEKQSEKLPKEISNLKWFEGLIGIIEIVFLEKKNNLLQKKQYLPYTNLYQNLWENSIEHPPTFC